MIELDERCEKRVKVRLDVGDLSIEEIKSFIKEKQEIPLYVKSLSGEEKVVTIIRDFMYEIKGGIYTPELYGIIIV